MIKATRIEIKRLEDRDRNNERREAWRELADQCLVATNCFWQTWWDWHIANGSQSMIRQWYMDLLAWHKLPTKGRGRKPSCPIKAMSKECSNAIYHRLADEVVPTLITRTTALLMNRLTSRLTSQKSAHGSMPWWCNLLLYRERVPASTEPQPIPFDKNNAALIVPENRDGDWLFEFRVERAGKGKSISDRVELWTRGRKCESLRKILARIADGTYRMLGSVMTTDRGKWFLNITYELPETEKKALDSTKRMILFCGRKDPWIVKRDDGLWWRGGMGRHIGAMRRRCMLERRGRQESYQWAGGAQRGHGRKRATSGWTRLRNMWTNVCSNYNRHVAKAVVAECVASGYGKLEYWQPCGRHVDTRFLSTAGKHPERRESTSYPFYQMATRLAQLCQEHGVELVVKKVGDEKQAENTSEHTATDVQAVRGDRERQRGSRAARR